MSRITPVMTGTAIGLLAVAAQWLFTWSSPQAYGICVACHSRDMLGWIVNNLVSSTVIEVTSAGAFTPLLTVVGIMVGAHLAARRHTVRPKSGINSNTRMFLLGFLVMTFALLLAACPIRLLLRIGYGDPLALFGGLWMVAGVIGGIAILRRWGS
ncbi:MAG: hypothetical protein M8352_02520 [ANME-2 cluster archaeon]|nr:hypothetical protein [ANME-2 cluster archaeon]MDF1532419.1 hypothetical protein [ANME-2 cluster archaeon]